jgi:hypothetical protein
LNQAQGTVLNPASGPANYNGERFKDPLSGIDQLSGGKIGGPSLAVDPHADMRKNWLTAGGPLLPKGATGGVVG